ncbi:MAG: TIGR03915 family putative DNA repair protein [Planctomycetota bacterium]
MKPRPTQTIVLDGTLACWRAHARALASEGVEPAQVRWSDPLRRQGSGNGDLFENEVSEPTPLPGNSAESAPQPLSVPRAFAERLKTVACFRSEDVWDVAYRLLFRIVSGERRLLDDPLDAEVAAFQRMEKAVRRDAHKMHAFVRFRRVEEASARNGERFIAWHEPSHRIVEREASFFRDRFPSMDWSILTPDGCAHQDGDRITFTEGVARDAAPDADELEALWCAYYASIFNPARVKLKAMTAEMPKKFWSTLPETAQIPDLLADVPRRLEEMAKNSRKMADSAMPFVPFGAPLEELREALDACEGCELFQGHGRPLLSEGSESARIAILGEQPGDVEERAGRPFVGPAGQVLDAALEAAQLERSAVYLTNAVKHFRHEVQVLPGERGKRRIHKRPTIEHVSRCQPWLDAELQRVQPDVFVCLGVTAARAVFGPTFRLPGVDDEPIPRSSRYAERTLVTFHPAAALRARENGQETARSHAVSSHIERTLKAARQLAQSE